MSVLTIMAVMAVMAGDPLQGLRSSAMELPDNLLDLIRVYRRPRSSGPGLLQENYGMGEVVGGAEPALLGQADLPQIAIWRRFLMARILAEISGSRCARWLWAATSSPMTA